MEQLRVGVLMGGPSAEHAISLKSGQGVVQALLHRGWPVEAISIPQDLTIEEAIRFARQALERSEIELAFIALHGPFGEDGTIQRLCEELGLAYTGSDVHASRLGLDKVASRRRFEEHGLRVPAWRVVNPAEVRERERIVGTLQFPVVIKPTNQGSSIGVSIVTHPTELPRAIEAAARYDTRILVEEFVRGREVTVGVLGDEALPVIEIQPLTRFFDYTAKYTPGQTRYVVPALLEAQLTRQVQEVGLRAHQALRCRDFSRVDLILNDAHEPIVLEVNTVPGLTATSLLPKAAACVDLSYDELCERVVRMASLRSRQAVASSTTPP